MSKLVGRKPVDINIRDLKDGHIPIYDKNRGLWYTTSTSSIVQGISGSKLELNEVTASVGFSGPLIGTASNALVALEVLQTSFTGSFTGSFIGDGDGLEFTTLHTNRNIDSELLIGNKFNNYQYKQKTIFKNGDIEVSGSVTIANNGLLVLTPQDAPANPVGGAVFYSASGEFFVGTPL